MEYSQLTRKERRMQLLIKRSRLLNIVKKLTYYLCWERSPGSGSMFLGLSLFAISLVAVVVSIFGEDRFYLFLILTTAVLLLQLLPRTILAKTKQCIRSWSTT